MDPYAPGCDKTCIPDLGLEDAAEEMKRMEALEKARIEMNGGEKEKPMKQNMFKVV